MSQSCVTRAAQTSTRVVTTDSLFLSYRTVYVTYPASRETLTITPSCVEVLGTGPACGTPIATTIYVTYPGSTATSQIPVTITSHYYATYVTTLTTTSCTTISTLPPSSSRPPSTSPIYNPPPSSSPPPTPPPPPTTTTTVISTVVVPPPTPSTSNLLSTGSPSATSSLTRNFSTSFDTPTSFPSPTIMALPVATTTNSSRNVAPAVGFGVGGVGAAVLLGLVFYLFILPKLGSLFGLKVAKSVALHKVIREPDFDNDFNQHDQTENGQGNIQVQDIQTTRRGNAYYQRHNQQGYDIRPNQVTMPQVAGGYPSGSSWGTNTRATGYPGSVPVAAVGHNIGPVSYTTSPDSSLLSATSAVQNGLHRHQSYTGSGSPDSAQPPMMRSMSLFRGQYTGCAESMG